MVRGDDYLLETGQKSRHGVLRVRQAARDHRFPEIEERYQAGAESVEVDGEDDESFADERVED